MSNKSNFGNVLIYGAGASGVLIRELIIKNELGKLIAFIEDNPKLDGKQLVGLDIIHTQNIDRKFIIDNHIDVVFLSNIYVHLYRSEYISNLGVKTMLLKDLDSWEEGHISVDNLIEIDSSFIINRPTIQDLDKRTNDLYSYKRILVTGAAGSIGSEIVRQLVKSENLEIVMVDINESALHDFSIELGLKSNVRFKVCDISDRNELERVFIMEGRFDYVFHAAAYKHVPIVEEFPYPALRVNLVGTLNLCKLARQYEAANFTLISTDKAVNPTNIMGASKRIAELISIYFSQLDSSTNFICTRFGNVLGSRGSAIPLFIEQIKSGKAITLTNKEMTRYFMTIPEAAQLVLISASLQEGPGVYLFDMGDPIKLTEIIDNLKIYYEKDDINIELTGLRKGEKLFEELRQSNDIIQKTKNSKISKVQIEMVSEILFNEIMFFVENFKNLDLSDIKEKISEVLPEYKAFTIQ